MGRERERPNQITVRRMCACGILSVDHTLVEHACSISLNKKKSMHEVQFVFMLEIRFKICCFLGKGIDS